MEILTKTKNVVVSKVEAIKMCMFLTVAGIVTPEKCDDQKGLTTVELLIILAVVCVCGLLWKYLGEQIKILFTKIIDFLIGFNNIF